MRTCLVFAIVAMFLVTAGPGPAQAQQPGLPTQFPMVVVFNENCIGFWTMDSEFIPLQCSIQPDPISGIPVPTFILPQPVVAGDVIVLEPDGTPADLIRFPAVPGTAFATTMLYFSEFDPNEPNSPPSDVGLPEFDPNNATMIDEVGFFELFDRFEYSPDQGTLYLGISDSPPRP
jgi:hypothetical protein